ncbi:PilZ domain-containing protein [Planctobacterium marinum]|uniref:PilZ domain-containing protein n=1 Tax=Planctobacterium marinum TaxID=1631968 RepID=UPI001E48E907|nr:PilZ domain-containing protein [Planctobacterium marinum]MCC2604176.1 PilZ domain-containing protein [Planctobacterium marinum]
MSDTNITQKLEQYHEYFTIKHVLNVNLLPVEAGFTVPTSEQLITHMPYAFRMAGELAELETRALRPLRHLGDHARELAEFLNHQSKKIDLMMSYILHQQDDQDNRYSTTEFGGAGLTVTSNKEMLPGGIYQLKIFLEEEAAAVFCYAEAILCEPLDEDQFKIAFIYNSIREQDQELLVRASLHLQTKHLKSRTDKIE